MTTSAKTPKPGSLVTYLASELTGYSLPQEHFFGIVISLHPRLTMPVRVDWMDGMIPSYECPHTLEVLSE